MSQTPTARASPAGSPAPARQGAINLEGIYTNIPILINRVRNNQLAASQIPSLRNLIASHAKEIIIFHARLGRGNPLLNLPDVLNPTKKVGTSEALTTENAFLSQVRAGLEVARNTRPDTALISAMAAKQAAAGRPPANPAAQRVQSTTTSAAASAAPSPSASTDTPAPTSAPSSQPQPTPTPGTATPTTTTTPAAPVTPPMTLQQVKDIIAMPADQRTKKLESDPVFKQRFVASYTFYQKKTAQARAPATAGAGAGSGAATPTQAPVRPPATTASQSSAAAPAAARTSPAPTPTAPTQPPSASTPSQPQPTPSSSAPPPPRPAPRAPSPPPEPEPIRRRRKLREYMREQAPNLDIELDMDIVFSDVLDTMVDSVMRDAVRLAAHRSSSRVELKDVAFVLEHYHDIVVPGFNAQSAKRVHLESEKKGKVVAPRRRREEDKE